MMSAVGVDVGGTHLRVGRVSSDGVLTQVVRERTPAGGGTALVDAIVRVVETFGDDLPVGVGIAGMVTPQGVLRHSPNLPVVDVALADDLRAALGRHLVVVNDGTAAAFGEHRVGAGAGLGDVVMFTLGTGVGGGVVIDGRPVVGHQGFAGEVGHVQVVPDGLPCACGLLGCLEAYASGGAVARLHAQRCRQHDDAPAPLSASQVVHAAQDGDEVAREVIDEAATHLGRVAAHLVTLLDPAIVLLGGGAGTALTPMVEPTLRTAMASQAFGVGHRTLPDVRAAALGDDAGIVGAGLLALGRTTRTGGPGRPEDR